MGFKIGQFEIGLDQKPLIIAEMSGNHNQSLERALNIVSAAADCGADMLKLQTYTADTMTMDIKSEKFRINEDSSLWKGQSLYELFKKAHTPWEWHKPIIEKAKSLNVMCFSTPFDETAVDFLEELNTPAYKIASFENIHLPLIRKVAATGKPLIISTGMASISELDDLVQTIRREGCNKFVLLKCTSTYPALPCNSNVVTIPHMRNLFNCEVGLSDHTMGIGTSLAAIANGATVIEKHFTLSRSDGGVDSEFSLEPNEMKLLVEETKRCWQSLGKVFYGPTDAEFDSIKYRKSIFISKNVSKGDIITEDNIRVIRPGNGLEPKFKDIVIGMKVSSNIEIGTPLTWDLLK